MPSFDIGHIKVQGQDVILVALDRQFGMKSESDQQDALAEFGMRCRSAGLRGSVAILWDGGFIGPRNWRSFLESIDLQYAISNRNRKISW